MRAVIVPSSRMAYHVGLGRCDQDNVPDHSALGKSLGRVHPDDLLASTAVWEQLATRQLVTWDHHSLFDGDPVSPLAWPGFLRLTTLLLRQKLREPLEVIIKPG